MGGRSSTEAANLPFVVSLSNHERRRLALLFDRRGMFPHQRALGRAWPVTFLASPRKVTKRRRPQGSAFSLYLEFRSRKREDGDVVDLVWQGNCSLSYPWAAEPVPEHMAQLPSRPLETRTVVGAHRGAVRICKEGL